MEKPLQALTGSEPFLHLGTRTDFDLLSFWQWAHSELNTNTRRGIMAEFIVARALGAHAPTRIEWESYDLETPDGIKVEVKASGTWQSWAQTSRSKIEFGIAPKRYWDKDTAKYSREMMRPADVYVFCLLHHEERELVNPLDLDQWTFHVISRGAIEKHLGNQKRAVLGTLTKIGAKTVRFSGLKEAVQEAAATGKLMKNESESGPQVP